MSTRIYWSPPRSADAFQFELRRAATALLPLDFWQRLSTVPVGPNWDPLSERFFADDAAGDAQTVYEVLAFAASGATVADSGPFQPAVAQTALLLTRTKVDHDFGQKDALRYLSTGGVGLPDVEIRIFTRADFDAGRTDLPLFRLQTADDGRWRAPVYLTPGLDYVVWFAKPGAYGPDTRVITV